MRGSRVLTSARGRAGRARGSHGRQGNQKSGYALDAHLRRIPEARRRARGIKRIGESETKAATGRGTSVSFAASLLLARRRTLGMPRLIAASARNFHGMRRRGLARTPAVSLAHPRSRSHTRGFARTTGAAFRSHTAAGTPRLQPQSDRGAATNVSHMRHICGGCRVG
jgi:hypothetical protein